MGPFLAFALLLQPPASALPTVKPVGTLEVVATFDGPMPTGVTVSKAGRVFVNYPRWGDAVEFTVAEVKAGKATAYPDATKPDTGFLPFVEGKPLLTRKKPNGPRASMTFGADGIAISNDGKYLYYCPLSSRRLHRVPTEALAGDAPDAEVGKAVEDLPVRPFASDGLESDAQGRLYLTDYEHNAVVRRNADGSYDTIAHDTRMLWPDTMSLATDGYLDFTANQLNRQKQFHNFKDERVKPYTLFRVKVDGMPLAPGGAK